MQDPFRPHVAATTISSVVDRYPTVTRPCCCTGKLSKEWRVVRTTHLLRYFLCDYLYFLSPDSAPGPGVRRFINGKDIFTLLVTKASGARVHTATERDPRAGSPSGMGARLLRARGHALRPARNNTTAQTRHIDHESKKSP